MVVPCRNCEDRVLGCHSNCSDYINYQEQRELICKKRLEESEIVYSMSKSIGRAKDAMNKKYPTDQFRLRR